MSRRLNPDTPETGTLQFLVEERRKFVMRRRDTQTALPRLKMCFPQVLEWFDEIGSNIAAEFLERWPSLDNCNAPDRLQSGAFSSNITVEMPNVLRNVWSRSAMPRHADEAVIASCSATVVAWANFLRQLVVAITDYDEKIDTLAREHPDYKLMNSFPRSRAALTLRLIAALERQRDQYQTAYEIQCYSGIAPVVASSGKQHWSTGDSPVRSFCGRLFTRALHSVAFSQWAHDYYDGLLRSMS